MYIRKFTYTAADVDCKMCTEYQQKIGCRHEVCPYIEERIEAGVVTYEDAVTSMIPRARGISKRLPKLFREYPGSLWADTTHKNRMTEFNHRLGYNKRRNTPSYYAVMYLFTSNELLFQRTGNCFYHSGIEFAYAVLRGINTHNYALFYAAKGLRNSGGVTVSELADPEVIDDEAFRLIINALLIAKYGTAVFKLKGEESK